MYQFQEYLKALNKSNENLSKDWFHIFRKLPELFANESTKKPFQPSLSSIPEVPDSSAKQMDDKPGTENEKVSKTVPEPNTAESQESPYNISLISGWTQKRAVEPPKPDNVVPKWRDTVSVHSPVSFSYLMC